MCWLPPHSSHFCGLFCVWPLSMLIVASVLQLCADDMDIVFSGNSHHHGDPAVVLSNQGYPTAAVAQPTAQTSAPFRSAASLISSSSSSSLSPLARLVRAAKSMRPTTSSSLSSTPSPSPSSTLVLEDLFLSAASEEISLETNDGCVAAPLAAPLAAGSTVASDAVSDAARARSVAFAFGFRGGDGDEDVLERDAWLR